MSELLRVGTDPSNPPQKRYGEHFVSELGIVTLPIGIYGAMEEEVRNYTQRYLTDIAGMFNDLQGVCVEMAKIGNLTLDNKNEFEKHANGLWAQQTKIMYHLHATYALLGTSTIPSVLLPKSILNPNSVAYFIDPDKQTTIPANLHMFNQDAYFYHIGGIGFRTYLYIDNKIEFI